MSENKRRGTRGMGSVYKKRSVWWIQYYHNGQRIRESSESRRKKDATDLLKRRLAEIATGKFIGRKEQHVTFAELHDDLQADYRTKGHTSWNRVARAVKHLDPWFGRDKAHQITADRIARYSAARLDEGAARATVVNELAALKRMFSVATELGKLSARPKFPKFGNLKNARQEFIEDWEYAALLGELPKTARPMVTFTFFSGWRWNSEVRPLQWNQVDWDRYTVTLPPNTTKNNEPRVLPFGKHPQLTAALQTAQANTEQVEQETGELVPWVFHTNGTPFRSDARAGFYAVWKEACLRAGVRGRDGQHKILHDCRRSTVRRYERSAVSRELAQKLVGHKTDSMYKRYNIVAEDELADAVAQSVNDKPPISHRSRQDANASTVKDEA